ncbi:MAG: phage major capsid protein, partial [Hypericibacter sp.]
EPALTNLGAADWVQETEVRPNTTTPSMAKKMIPTHDLYCNPPVSQRLLDNSHYDIGATLVARIGKAFGQKEGTAFVSGSGVARPMGFLTYASAAVATADDTRDWGKLQYVPTGQAAAIAADSLIDISEELAPEYRANARWVMSRRTAAIVRKLKDGQGDYLWANSLIAGQPPTLLGYGVTIADDMPSVGANSFPIAFGDFREGYCVVDSAKMTILRDPFSNKPFVNFYTVQRTGGDVRDYDAIKLLKVAVS